MGYNYKWQENTQQYDNRHWTTVIECEKKSVLKNIHVGILKKYIDKVGITQESIFKYPMTTLAKYQSAFINTLRIIKNLPKIMKDAN